MKVSKLHLEELSIQEQMNTEGGVIPLVAIGVGWSLMAGMSTIALAMKDKYL